MKVTEQAIREAMKLAPGVAVTLGTLDEALRTRIAVVGSGLYTVVQSDLGGLKVTMTLQFAAHNPAIVGYPSTVEFYLSDVSKLRKMQEGVSEFVTHLQATGQHDAAAKVAALLTLPAEDVERIYDALTSGLSKAEFIAQIEAETGANISKGFVKAPSGDKVRLGNENSKHLYELGVNIGGGISRIEVMANDRGQANRIATKAGYEVRDVNMVG